MSAESSSIHC